MKEQPDFIIGTTEDDIPQDIIDALDKAYTWMRQRTFQLAAREGIDIKTISVQCTMLDQWIVQGLTREAEFNMVTRAHLIQAVESVMLEFETE